MLDQKSTQNNNAAMYKMNMPWNDLNFTNIQVFAEYSAVESKLFRIHLRLDSGMSVPCQIGSFFAVVIQRYGGELLELDFSLEKYANCFLPFGVTPYLGVFKLLPISVNQSLRTSQSYRELE